MPSTKRAAARPATPSRDFQAVFDELKRLMRPYVGKLKPIDKPGDFQLIGPPVSRSMGKDVWFGAVRIGKNYVSYYLMPVYAFPDLLDGISPELRKRMQGKSCFNFTAINKTLFTELKRLTKAGYERFNKEQLV